MFFFKKVCYPLNEVVFENSLDELVEEVWGDQFVDVCMRKVFGEWLEGWRDQKVSSAK